MTGRVRKRRESNVVRLALQTTFRRPWPLTKGTALHTPALFPAAAAAAATAALPLRLLGAHGALAKAGHLWRRPGLLWPPSAVGHPANEHAVHLAHHIGALRRAARLVQAQKVWMREREAHNQRRSVSQRLPRAAASGPRLGDSRSPSVA